MDTSNMHILTSRLHSLEKGERRTDWLNYKIPLVVKICCYYYYILCMECISWISIFIKNSKTNPAMIYLAAEHGGVYDVTVLRCCYYDKRDQSCFLLQDPIISLTLTPISNDNNNSDDNNSRNRIILAHLILKQLLKILTYCILGVT